MGQPNTTKSSYRFLQQALRVWRKPDRIPRLFQDFYTFRSSQADSASEKRRLGYLKLEDYLTRLGETEAGQADLLRRRYSKGSASQRIAYEKSVSRDHVNRLQQQATLSLARLIDEDETRLQRALKEQSLNNLPPSNYLSLTGRKRLIAKIVQAVHDPAVGVISVVGMGGIGKTALADATARELIEELAFVRVFWFQLSAGLNAVDTIVGELAHALLPADLPHDRFYRELRASLAANPTLIVYDGLEPGHDIDRLSNQLAALARPSKFLITCRQLPGELANCRIIQVPDLNRGEAEILLVSRLTELGIPRVKKVRTNLSKVMDVTGGNPLALKLFAGLLLSMAIENLLGRSSAKLFDGVFADIYTHAWKTMDSNERVVLEAMSVVAPSGATIAHIQAVTGLSEGAALKAVHGLSLRSLLEQRHNEHYGIHRLTLAFLNSLSQNGENLAKANAHYWLAEIESKGAALVVGSEEGNLRIAIDRCFERKAPALAKQLLAKVHKAILRSTSISVWLPLFERGVATAAKSQLASSEYRLASLHWRNRNDEKAGTLFARAFKHAEQAGQVREQANAKFGLALCLLTQNALVEARRTALTILQNHRELTPRAKGNVLMVLGAIAFALGNYSSANKSFTRAKTYVSADPLAIVQSLIGRALALQMAGNHLVAIKQYRLASDRLIQLPELRQERLQVELLRSEAFYQMGDLSNAQDCLERAMLSAESKKDFLGRALAESSLGKIALEKGKTEQAGTYLRSASKLWKKVGKPQLTLSVHHWLDKPNTP